MQLVLCSTSILGNRDFDTIVSGFKQLTLCHYLGTATLQVIHNARFPHTAPVSRLLRPGPEAFSQLCF